MHTNITNMHTNIYTYMYIYIYTNAHTHSPLASAKYLCKRNGRYICISIYIYIYVYMRIYMYTNIHTICIYILTQTHTRSHLSLPQNTFNREIDDIHVYQIYTYTDVYSYIYMYTNLYTYLYACTYINKHTRIHLSLLQSTFTREIDDIKPCVWVQVYIRNLFHVRKCSSVLVFVCLYTYINMIWCVLSWYLFHVHECSSILVCVCLFTCLNFDFVCLYQVPLSRAQMIVCFGVCVFIYVYKYEFVCSHLVPLSRA